jgi:hypothetical protein
VEVGDGGSLSWPIGDEMVVVGRAHQSRGAEEAWTRPAQA